MLDVKIYFLERCKSARNIVQHIGVWLDHGVGSLDVHQYLTASLLNNVRHRSFSRKIENQDKGTTAMT